MPESLHRPDYATSELYKPRSRLTLGQYVYLWTATALFLSVPILPGILIQKQKDVFADFHLKLPAITQTVNDTLRLLDRGYVRLWVWTLPFIVPLFIVRLSPLVRQRLWVIGLLILAHLIVFLIAAMTLPMPYLLEGFALR